MSRPGSILSLASGVQLIDSHQYEWMTWLTSGGKWIWKYLFGELARSLQTMQSTVFNTKQSQSTVFKCQHSGTAYHITIIWNITVCQNKPLIWTEYSVWNRNISEQYLLSRLTNMPRLLCRWSLLWKWDSILSMNSRSFEVLISVSEISSDLFCYVCS